MKRPVLAFALLLPAAALAEHVETAQMCAGLWYQRNAIFKSAGYCFRSPDAIAVFGNAGCRYDRIEDVPLSPFQREAAAMYAREEHDHACHLERRPATPDPDD